MLLLCHNTIDTYNAKICILSFENNLNSFMLIDCILILKELRLK